MGLAFEWDSQKEVDHNMREEYDFSAARPNKYAEQYATGTNLVLLAPDVAARFPDSAAVNRALRLLIRLAQQEVKPTPES